MSATRKVLLKISCFIVNSFMIQRWQKFPNRLKFLVMIWIAMAVLLSNDYKGVLFSQLTTPSDPPYPKNLQEAVNFGLPMVTVSVVRSGNRSLSAARQKIDEILATGNENTNWYRKMNSTLSFIEAGIPKIISSIVDKIKISSDGRNLTISDETIFLDAKENVILFAQLIPIFDRKNKFKIGSDLNSFSTRSQWMLGRNYFSRLAEPYLRSLCESGIYSMWNFYEQLISRYWSISDAFDLINRGSKMEFKNPGNLIARLLKVHHIPPTFKSKAVDMEYFSVLAFLWIYCITVSAVFFLAEILQCRRKVKRWIN